MRTLRRIKVLFFSLVVLPACATLTPADKATIAADAVDYSVCEAEAHLCKLDDAGSANDCWKVYDSCLQAHGLGDGGTE